MKGFSRLSSQLVISSMILFVVSGLFVVLPDTVSGLDSGFRMDSDLSDSHASFWGEDADDYSGYSLSGAGDVNGDGYDDILIGAYGDDDGGNAAGQTYLILGKSSGWSIDTDLSTADASFWGEDAGDRSGYSVSGAGDVNGDGYDDILIGALSDGDSGSWAGQTYLIFGKASGWSMDTDLSTADASFWGEDGSDRSGCSVSGAGDVNGDGYDDILIGALYDEDGGNWAGQTYLILGKASGWSMDTHLSAADASFWGEDADDQSGGSVSSAGDVNGDGFDDILIGASNDEDGGNDAGQTYLILGNASGWSMDTNLSEADASFWGEDGGDRSGCSVSGAGDVNGDGFDDILIGASNDEDGGNDAGQTYLIFGKASGWSMDTNLSTADASFWGEDTDDKSGGSVSSAGDVNGDGYDDILISAIGDEDGGIWAGQTYLIMGKSSGWSMDTNLSKADASFWGEDVNDFSGCSVSGAGDVNDDGYDDILIGAYGDEEGGSLAGQTYLILFNSNPPAPNDFQATLHIDGSKITLIWENCSYWNRPITGYRIYRSTDGSNYKHIITVPPTNRTYVDINVDLGRVYYYSIVTVDGDGSFSKMTTTISLMNDLDTDFDGIGNFADWDDDGDNIPDHNDAFPLNPSEWLDTDLDGVGNSADTDDDNDGIADNSDIYPLNPLNDLSNTIAYMNSSLIMMNSDLASLQNDVDLLETSLTNLINGLSSDIDGLSLKIDDLSEDLHNLDSSLHSELSALRSDLSTFKSETKSSLQDIISQLKNLGDELSAEIEMLNNTINNLESTTLNDIKQQITEVRSTITQLSANEDIENILTKLSEVELTVNDIYAVTNLRLDNITIQLKELDEMETIVSNIETIEELLKEVEAAQDETIDTVNASSSGIWVAVVLLIIVILLLIILIARVGKGKEDGVVPSEDLEVISISKSTSPFKSKKKVKKKAN